MWIQTVAQPAQNSVRLFRRRSRTSARAALPRGDGAGAQTAVTQRSQSPTWARWRRRHRDFYADRQGHVAQKYHEILPTAGSSVAMGSLPCLLLLTLLTTTAHAADHPFLDCHGTIWDSRGPRLPVGVQHELPPLSAARRTAGTQRGLRRPRARRHVQVVRGRPDEGGVPGQLPRGPVALGAREGDAARSAGGAIGRRTATWRRSSTCGAGAGVHKPHPPSPPKPPPPPPPIECQGQPMLENLSVRDPPRECNFYDGNGMGCSGAYVRNEGASSSAACTRR